MESKNPLPYLFVGCVADSRQCFGCNTKSGDPQPQNRLLPVGMPCCFATWTQRFQIFRSRDVSCVERIRTSPSVGCLIGGETHAYYAAAATAAVRWRASAAACERPRWQCYWRQQL